MYRNMITKKKEKKTRYIYIYIRKFKDFFLSDNSYILPSILQIYILSILPTFYYKILLSEKI